MIKIRFERKQFEAECLQAWKPFRKDVVLDFNACGQCEEFPTCKKAEANLVRDFARIFRKRKK